MSGAEKAALVILTIGVLVLVLRVSPAARDWGAAVAIVGGLLATFGAIFVVWAAPAILLIAAAVWLLRHL